MAVDTVLLKEMDMVTGGDHVVAVRRSRMEEDPEVREQNGSGRIECSLERLKEGPSHTGAMTVVVVVQRKD
jgi:hypothetical protein